MDELASRKYPVREHMRFQRRFWVVERVGWVLLATITLLALLGMFGTGVLSETVAKNGSLTVTYDRFERKTRLSQFSFHFAASNEGKLRLRLNSAFQRNYQIAGMTPQPIRSSSADGIDLTFAAQAGQPADVTIWAHPRGYGTMHLEARAYDERPVSIAVFVYP